MIDLRFEFGDPGFLSFHHLPGIREEVGGHGHQEYTIDQGRHAKGALRDIEVLGRGDGGRILEGAEDDRGFVVAESVPGFREGEAGGVHPS